MCFVYIYIYILTFIFIKPSYIFIFKFLSISVYVYMYLSCPVGWGCRLHRLDPSRGIKKNLNVCPGYDTKQSDGEAPVMLELWKIRSTSSLSLLSGQLWPGVVANDLCWNVSYTWQYLELFNCVQKNELWLVKKVLWIKCVYKSFIINTYV